MSSGEVVWMTVPVLGFLIAAHVLGHVFVRFRQPRVIGEILAGCLLGPSVLGQVAPSVSRAIFGGQLQGSNQRAVLDSVYWFGLLLLMFVSGAGTRHLFCREDRSRTAVLALFGTGLPFLFVLGAGPFLPVESIMGPAHQRMALKFCTRALPAWFLGSQSLKTLRCGQCWRSPLLLRSLPGWSSRRS